MTTQEIKINIERIKETIKLNYWSKAHVEILKSQLDFYNNELAARTQK